MRVQSIGKKVLSVLLSVCIAILFSLNAFAAYYVDIPALDEEYKDAINYVTDNGLMNGTSTQYFSPYSNVNRAMFITILYRMSGDSGNYDGSSIFIDVPSNSYYNEAVGWAFSTGITTGTANNTFNPTGLLNVAQAMVFMHRYATYKQYNSTDRESILSYFDYCLVPVYAQDAMSWAVSFGILPSPGALPGYLEPTNSFTRAECALMICRFIQNVRGFLTTSDGFQFNQFHFIAQSEQRYCISSDDWSYLSNYSNINPNKPWTGYCFGMSVAALLDFYGKIDLNGNYCNNIDTIYNIPYLDSLNSNPSHIITTDHLDSSIQITEVESKIALYQYSAALGFVAASVDCLPATFGEQNLHQMVDDLQHGGAGLFKFTFTNADGTTGGHAVVVSGKPIQINNGYKLYAYDCNNPGNNSNTWLEINTHCAPGQLPNNTTWTACIKHNGITEYDNITKCKFQNDLSCFAELDVDGWYNDNYLLEDLLRNYTIIEIDASNNFSICNSYGETLSFTNAELSGTMDVMYYDFIPSSPDAPVTYYFVVDQSDSFTCTPSSFSSVSGMSIYQNEKRVDVLSRDFEESGSIAVKTN